MPNHGKLVAIALAAAGILAGCGQKPKSSSGLTVSTHAGTTTDASPAGLTLPNGIEITEIRMAVRKIFVEGDDAENVCSTSTSSMPPPMMSGWTGSNDGDDWGGDWDHRGPERDDDGECEFAFGPFDVDLAGSALSGAVAFAFDAPIPPGTYERVGIDVATVTTTAAGDNAVLLALAGLTPHASIVVDGFVQVDASTSVPFSFHTPMHVRQVRKGQIVIAEGTNVTLDFDPTGWFTGPDGARLDPNDPTARGEILENIRASIRLIKDDDHDDVDDDAEHHGSGDGGGMGGGMGGGQGRGG